MYLLNTQITNVNVLHVKLYFFYLLPASFNSTLIIALDLETYIFSFFVIDINYL